MTDEAAPTGSYTGRLAFDSDSGFHTDPDGNKVVTEDEGKTWRYAKDDDFSHISRYHQAFAEVDTTANVIANESLPEEEAREAHPHHFEVQPEDPHFERPQYDPDMVAHTITSHTEAYSG